MKHEEDRFAIELLAEVKAQSKRYFIALIIMIIVEALTVAWFTLPASELSRVTVESNEDGNASYYSDNTISGDLNNGENNSSHEKEKNDEPKENNGESKQKSK